MLGAIPLSHRLQFGQTLFCIVGTFAGRCIAKKLLQGGDGFRLITLELIGNPESGVCGEFAVDFECALHRHDGRVERIGFELGATEAKMQSCIAGVSLYETFK